MDRWKHISVIATTWRPADELPCAIAGGDNTETSVSYVGQSSMTEISDGAATRMGGPQNPVPRLT